MDYKNTLNLPKTGFSMKANLIEKEPKIQKFWEDNRIYEKILEKNKNNPKFVLHDGPPYANGEPHIGTSFGKVLKDIVNRFHFLNGFYTYFKPGWDCHGQPIELRALEELNIKDTSKIDKMTIRRKCEEFALKFVNVQRELFKRLGIFADWDNPYLTLSKHYESKIVEMFKLLYEQGYIYRALKPIYWCKSCKTALADAEVEYTNLSSPSIYVLFNFTTESIKKLQSITGKKVENCGIIVWTTTPWTLPGNLAVTLNPEFKYVFIKTKAFDKDYYFLMVSNLVATIFNKLGLKVEEVIEIEPRKLEHLEYHRPIEEKPLGKIILDTFVSKEDGTGCVHTAPGHGEEDYYAGLKYKIEPYSPVNESGQFVGTVDWLNGEEVFASQKEIVEYLRNRNSLLFSEEIEHSYPICWRCKNPLIYRATSQWFLDIDKNNLRQKLLDSTETVNWIPSWGKTRISNMIKNRPHWCLSRQRSWGVPLPIFYCSNCSHELTNVEIIEKIQNLFLEHGSNIWFEKDENFLLGKQYKCDKCRGTVFKKGEDILDVWFESGVSWFAVLSENEKLSYPCNYYLEGNDQHRGWFQVSLIPSVAVYNKAPYRTVLTHGFIITDNGEKISKSAATGRTYSTSGLLKEYGADVLRLAVLAWNPPDDLSISREYLDQVAQNYVKIRNSFRFILANLYDFNPDKHKVPYNNLNFVDKVFYNKMMELLKNLEYLWQEFQLHKIYSLLSNFIILDLSALYFDILKEKLYTLHPDDVSRRSAQTVLWHILNKLVLQLAPVLPYTAEDIYSFFPQKKYESIHLMTKTVHKCESGISCMEDERCFDIEKDVLEKWCKVIQVRNDVNKVLEELRNKKVIGRSREGKLVIDIKDKNLFELLQFVNSDCERSEESQLEDIFLVSKIVLNHNDKIDRDYIIYASKYDVPKCERCWLYSETVGRSIEYPDICEKCVKIVQKIKV